MAAAAEYSVFCVYGILKILIDSQLARRDLNILEFQPMLPMLRFLEDRIRSPRKIGYDLEEKTGSVCDL